MLSALAVLSIAAIIALHIFLAGWGLVGKAQLRTQGVAWVQAELEYLRALGVNELVSHEVRGEAGPCRSGEPCLPSGFARGVVVVRQPIASGHEMPGIREVTVAIFSVQSPRTPLVSAATWIAERRWTP